MRGENLYVRAVSISGLLELAEKKGAPSEAWAKDVGLELPSRSNKIDFVSWNAICDFLERCAQRLDCPTFGIEWAYATPQDARNSGPIIMNWVKRRNLSDLLDLSLDYQAIHTNGVNYSYDHVESEGLVKGYIDIHPLSHFSRQYSEHIAAYILMHARRLYPEIKIMQVTFQHKAPEDLHVHHRVFGENIIFDAPSHTVTISDQILETSKSSAFNRKIALPLFEKYLNDRLRKSVPESSISTHVASMLPMIFGLRESGIAEVAKAMNISEKKLQRLLRQEGTTYSEIREKVREETARRLLITSDISITRLAKTLDYKTLESFHTACSRWFNCSARTFRQKSRNEDQ